MRLIVKYGVVVCELWCVRGGVVSVVRKSLRVLNMSDNFEEGFVLCLWRLCRRCKKVIASIKYE